MRRAAFLARAAALAVNLLLWAGLIWAGRRLLQPLLARWA